MGEDIDTTIKETCKKFVDGWGEVDSAKMQIATLSGGASGQGVFKVTAEGGNPGPAHVMYKQGTPTPGKPALAGYTLSHLARAGRCESGHPPCCGEVYLGGNVEYPGVQIQEFAEGGADPDVWGPGLLHNTDDARSWGGLLGALHSIPFNLEDYEQDSYKDMNTEDLNKQHPKLKDVIKKCVEEGKPELLGTQLTDLTVWLRATGEFWAVDSEVYKWFNAVADKAVEYLPQLCDGTSLMSRLVNCHGDAHGKQFVHRKKGGHGDLILVVSGHVTLCSYLTIHV